MEETTTVVLRSQVDEGQLRALRNPDPAATPINLVLKMIPGEDLSRLVASLTPASRVHSLAFFFCDLHSLPDDGVEGLCQSFLVSNPYLRELRFERPLTLGHNAVSRCVNAFSSNPMRNGRA
jgi:hypothetical protein